MARCFAVLASDDADLQARVRARLRALRTARGLTLDDVATRASMAPSTLSRLESGRRRIALDHLPALARALGVTTDELLAPDAHVDPRVHATPRRVDGLTFWPLTRSATAGLSAFKIEIAAERTVPEPRVHEGYEWLYVLAGRPRLVLGASDLTLAPGEAVEFSTRTPHWLGASQGSAEVLAILSAHGQRAHLRP
jgi:transcriptional regulator with XRE-family HTH domain